MLQAMKWMIPGLAFALTPLLLTGCTSGAGSGFSLMPPQGHKLTDSAKEVRDTNTHALMVPREMEKQPQPDYVVEPGDVLLIQPANLDSPVRLPAESGGDTS